MRTEYRITAFLDPEMSEPPSNKGIKNTLYLIGLIEVSVISLPLVPCSWQTANRLTDYEVRKCTTVAEFNGDPDIAEYLCLAHADLYRTIMQQEPTRIEQ
jgi:hypothetical protein